MTHRPIETQNLVPYKHRRNSLLEKNQLGVHSLRYKKEKKILLPYRVAFFVSKAEKFQVQKVAAKDRMKGRKKYFSSDLASPSSEHTVLQNIGTPFLFFFFTYNRKKKKTSFINLFKKCSTWYSVMTYRYIPAIMLKRLKTLFYFIYLPEPRCNEFAYFANATILQLQQIKKHM